MHYCTPKTEFCDESEIAMSLPTDALLSELQTTYDALLRTLALLTPDEIETVALENAWTPKAVLAHVAFWDQVQRRRLENAVAGAAALPDSTPPATSNDVRARRDADRPLDAILREAEIARTTLIRFAAGLTSQQWTTPYPEGDASLTPGQLIEHLIDHTRRHTGDLWRYCGSMRRWTPQSLRIFLARQDANLMDSLGRLTEQTLITPGAVGDWSLRDGLVHILAWREYGYRVVKQWPQVDRTMLAPWLDGGDVKAINAQLLAARAALNLIDIADGLTTYHRRLLTLLDRAGAAQLAAYGDPGRGEPCELSAFVYGLTLHEMEHAQEIWQWRVESGK